jgi:hypothetical protein
VFGKKIPNVGWNYIYYTGYLSKCQSKQVCFGRAIFIHNKTPTEKIFSQWVSDCKELKSIIVLKLFQACRTNSIEFWIE